jgi:hypothetical protein
MGMLLLGDRFMERFAMPHFVRRFRELLSSDSRSGHVMKVSGAGQRGAYALIYRHHTHTHTYTHTHTDTHGWDRGTKIFGRSAKSEDILKK